MELDAVRYARAGAVARIVLARPDTGNALDADMVAQLARAVRAASTEPGCRAIVLEATGALFCPGAHVAAPLGAGGASAGGAGAAGATSHAATRAFADCLALLCQAPVPTIACVEGDAMGGGVGLAAACDLVLATEDARFMLSEVIVGMIPALIAPVLLRRLTPGRVRYMMLSSRALSAAEAHAAGLVDELVPAGGMHQALVRQLDRIGRSAPHAIAAGKAFLDRLTGGDWDSRMNAAIELQWVWLQRADVKEALAAFADGFSPSWFQRLGRALDEAGEESAAGEESEQ